MQSAGPHKFTIGLIGAVLIAWGYPDAGLEGSFLRPEWTTKIGVFLIFFLQGLSLATSDLVAGVKPARLHGFVLIWNFLLFPGLTYLFILASGELVPQDLHQGFALLSILPTTIASAVTLTSLSNGRVSVSLFSTVASNLLAVGAVPLWVLIYLKSGQGLVLPIAPVLTELGILIVLPLVLGQCVRLRNQSFAGLAGRWSKPVSSGIILFIVYVAFAESVDQGVFGALAFAECVRLVVSLCVLFILVAWLVWLSSAFLRVSGTERKAAFFCASQKSLASGLPLATAIFAALPDSVTIDSGKLLLPLVVFHPIQLIVSAFIASKLSSLSR